MIPGRAVWNDPTVARMASLLGMLAPVLSACAERDVVTDSRVSAPVLGLRGTLPEEIGHALAMDGDTLAVLRSDVAFVDLVDLADLDAPARYAEIPLPAGVAMDVALGGGRVFVAFESVDGGDGVHDVSDGTAPAPLATWTDPASVARPDALALAGDLLYAGAQTGVVVLDVSDLAAPRTLGFAASPEGRVHDVAVADGVLYTSDESEGGWLRAWDASDPASLAATDTLAATLHPMIHAIVVAEGRLYGAWFEAGLLVWADVGGS